MKKRITTDRTSYMQTMCDIRLAPNLQGLTKEERRIAKKIYQEIPHYRKASRDLARTGYYVRNNIDYTATLWAVDGKDIVEVAETTKHRVRQIMRSFQDYKEGKINPDVWTNYCTGGYTTRIGLRKANNSERVVERIVEIAKTHAEYPSDIYTGEQGHQLRVSYR